jgi:cardiolipin synthase
MKTFFDKNDDESNLLKYSFYVAFKPVYQNNDINILQSNTEIYEEYIKAIRSAKSFIHFETYLIRDGFFMRTVFCELIKKAKAGIKVRFLYD